MITMNGNFSLRLTLSASIVCLTGACAGTPKAVLNIRAVDEAQFATADDKAIDRGKTLLSRGQNADAISAFRTALRQEENSAEAHNGLAIAYDRIGRKDLARRYFELAVADKPQDQRYRTNLARFFEGEGQAELAMGLMQTVPPKDMPVKVVATLTPPEPAAHAEAGVLPMTNNGDAPQVLSIAAAERTFVGEVKSMSEADYSVPEVLTTEGDEKIAAIIADLSAKHFAHNDIVIVENAKQGATISAAFDMHKLKSEPAVYRQGPAIAIEAASLSLPLLPVPERNPSDSNFEMIADFPRNDRKSLVARGPHIERISLGEVKLVTTPETKLVSIEPEFRLSDKSIALWVEEEQRKAAYHERSGLKGRPAILNVVNRIAIEDAVDSAEKLALTVEEMGREFTYILIEDEAELGRV
jgi:tetratricopeptide (TPR) repeat protein